MNKTVPIFLISIFVLLVSCTNPSPLSQTSIGQTTTENNKATPPNAPAFTFKNITSSSFVVNISEPSNTGTNIDGTSAVITKYTLEYDISEMFTNPTNLPATKLGDNNVSNLTQDTYYVRVRATNNSDDVSKQNSEYTINNLQLQ